MSLAKPLPLLAVGLVVIVLATSAVYWPGLYGSFTFDDEPNIVRNPYVHLTELSGNTLWQAAWRGEAGLLNRPISVATLALNHFFSGLDPFAYKLTNLTIHVLNGVGIAVLTWLLLGLVGDRSPRNRSLVCLVISAAWLLHPFNLTGVLYVIQRMTSLATLFMVLGTVFYLVGRIRLQHSRQGWVWILVTLFLFTPLAVLSKENGILIVFYLFVIELTILRFVTHHDSDRHVLQIIFGLVVGLPLAVGLLSLAVAADWLLMGYVLRDFSLEERLLTEARVVTWYIRMILLPDVTQMGLYLDDIQLSRSLLEPISTPWAVAFLVALGTTAFVARRKAPILSFGILWFFAGHLMESTVLPLELVYEHRNYLPSYGLIFLAAYYLLAPARFEKTLKIRYVVTALWIGVLGVSTYLRADQWSDEYRLMLTEVEHHPNSARTHAILAETYVNQTGRDNPKKEEYIDRTVYHYKRSLELQPNMASSLMGLIVLHDYHDRALDPTWLPELKRLLEEQPFSATSVNAVGGLTRCLADGQCDLSHEDYMSLILAAERNPSLQGKFRAHVLTYAADYFAEVREDYEAAIQYLEQAVDASQEAQFRASKIRWLVALARFDEALQEVENMEWEDKLGAWRAVSDHWRETIHRLRKETLSTR